MCHFLVGAEYGAVTALGINIECTRLLCGHARGQVGNRKQLVDNKIMIANLHCYTRQFFLQPFLYFCCD